MTINTSDVPPQVGDISAGDRGVWVLNDETPPSVLAGGAHGCSDLEVERLLGGLDQIPPAPTAEHIRVLAAQSVAIVWATFAATDERVAEAVVLKRLKGDTPRELTVTLTPAAGNSFQHFAADDRNRFGVLFLNHPDDSSWSVANSEDPAVYSLELVENALSGMDKTAKVTTRWETPPPEPD